MKLCPACDRHLFGPEPSCPFCGAPQATTAARASAGVAASFALGLALATAACGPATTTPEQTEGSSTAADGDTTSPPGPTTMATATTEPATADGPTTTLLSDTNDDDVDDAGCAFYAGCPPDGGDSWGECDIFAQDCPVGEKCNPWANDGGGTWNAARCVPVANDPDAAGEPCTVEGSATSGIDSCAEATMCFHVDPATNTGTCVALCSGSLQDPQCIAPEAACLVANDGVLALCLDTCDPLAPACAEGEGCHPSPLSDRFFCLPTFDQPGTHGQPCEAVAACAPGHVCVEASLLPACAGAACCAQLCDTTAGEPCPADDQGVGCEPWYEPGMAPAGLENVGVCVLL
jgi:hypothetical protein